MTDHVSPSVFWKKLRDNAGRIPFASELVAVWYCAIDPRTPSRVKAILMAAIAYFVLPIDLIPDFVLGLGYTDDLVVLAAAVRAVRPWINDSHRERARDALAKRVAVSRGDG